MMTDRMYGKIRETDSCVLALCAFAFALPLSLPVAETLLFIALLMGAYRSFCGDCGFNFRFGLAVPVALFACVALYGIIFSSRPSISFSKLHRLLFFLLIFQIPAVFGKSSGTTIDRLVMALLLGTAVKGVYDLIRIPLHVIQGGDLYDAGSMTGPQFYMVALCFLVAIYGMNIGGIAALSKKWFLLYAPALVLSFLGLILHFKRGVWLASAFCVGIILIAKRRWRSILALLVCLSAIVLLPQVKARLAQLPNEFAEVQGGRWVLWSEVAPELISENPGGIGWHATQHKDFLKYADYVQPNLDHLHNNILQITLELGIVGGLVWTLGMLWVVLYMGRTFRNLKSADGIFSDLSLGVLMGFVALLMNGMVENNFDDSEIMLLYCLLIGVALALQKRVPLGE